MNTVPGALRTYDLPDLAAGLGSRLTLVDSTDALGWSERESGSNFDPDETRLDRPGLIGIFYSSPNFTNPQSNDLLNAGDMHWDDAQLHRGNDWAVRWKGYLLPDLDGAISLGVDSTETAVVRLDSREVARCSASAPPVEGRVQCDAGQAIPIEVDFTKPGTNRPPPDGINRLRLRWKHGDGPWQTVPAAWLRHSHRQEYELEHLLR